MNSGPDPQTFFKKVLPLGEWTDIRLIKNPGGMMADSYGTLLAKAKSLRRNKQSVIKCIFPASSNAGPKTELVVSPERLERLGERLQALQARTDLPLVPLFEVKALENGALLLAMEQVEPLDQLIAAGRGSGALASRLMRDLNGSLEWHHFDVSPNNIGLLGERFVLIDPDSFYLRSENQIKVTLPAWKAYRAPPELAHRVVVELQRNKNCLSPAAALRKYTFEVLHAAAEVHLGALPPPLNWGTIKDWFATWGDRGELAGFWQAKLLEADSKSAQVDLLVVATELDEVLAGSGSSPPAAVSPISGAGPALVPPSPPEPPSVSIPDMSVARGDLESSEAERGWSLLRPGAQALRRGTLDQQGVSDYWVALQEFCGRHPQHRACWQELLHVAVACKKDPVAAQEVLRQALTHFPGDQRFEHWLGVVRMWAAG